MMTSNAELLTPEALRAAARYFSALPAPPSAGTELNAIGRALYENGKPNANVPACETCHGAATPNGGLHPRLDGKHAVYIAKQLRDFQEQTRGSDPDQAMQRIAGQLSIAEIDAVAIYISGLKRK